MALESINLSYNSISSGAGAAGRSSSSYAGVSKAPSYKISKPSTTLDVKSVARPSVTHKAKVLYDYDAAEDDELSLLADEVCIGRIGDSSRN